MRTSHALPVRELDRGTIVEMPAELDISNRDACVDQLLSVLSSRPSELIVDMSATSFCDSSGIHTLLRVRRRAELLECGLRVVAPNSAVQKVLRISGVHHTLPLYTSAEEALADIVTGRTTGSTARQRETAL